MSCQLCHTLKSEVALEHLHQHGAQTCVLTKFGAVIPGSEENTKCHKYISFFFGSFLSCCSLTKKKEGGYKLQRTILLPLLFVKDKLQARHRKTLDDSISFEVVKKGLIQLQAVSLPDRFVLLKITGGFFFH